MNGSNVRTASCCILLLLLTVNIIHPRERCQVRCCFKLTFVCFVLKLIVLLSAITALALYMLYYTHCGILFEPIQACIDMHQRAIDIGLQVGNPSYVAIHKQFLLVRKFHAGTNLLDLKEEFDCEIKSAEHHCSFPMLSVRLRLYYEAVLTLIGEDSSNDIDLDDELVYDREQSYVFSQLISLVYHI